MKVWINRSINCTKCKELLEAFIMNELNQTDRELVEDHLADCEACSQRESELLEMKLLTRQITPRSLPSALCTKEVEESWKKIVGIINECILTS